MWQSLGNIASIIQIITAIPFVWGAWLFFSRSRRYKRLMEQSGTDQPPKPMALIISVSGMDISGQVLDYLSRTGQKMEYRALVKKEGMTKDSFFHALSEVLRLKEEMTNDGATEVHLFCMAPIAFAVAVGAVLDNWVKVWVYQMNRQNQGETYERWSPLHKGFVPGLSRSLLTEQ